MDVDGFLGDMGRALVARGNGDFDLLEDGRKIALLAFEEDQDGLELTLIRVHQEHRRRGIASALLALTCTLADLHDVDLGLSILDHASPALPPFTALRRLYAGFGFVFDSVGSTGNDYRMRRRPAGTLAKSA